MFKYLALGDSYTIGEAVEQHESFPYQLVEDLNKEKNRFNSPPQVIAKTGWTTDELSDALDQSELQIPYDLITLLIGVNNQYRGRDAENFRQEFKSLLNRAIYIANDHKYKIFVLSIPDWSVTPFGIDSERDVKQIAQEIDLFNEIIKTECAIENISFTDITPISRNAATDSTLNASDGLHPSGTMYAQWVELLAPTIRKTFSI